MTLLIRWFSARHLWDEKGRTALTLLGVALGVALFVAIRLANHSAMASFRDTVDSVAGRANLQITASGGGLEEGLLPRIRAVPGVEAAAPLIQVLAPVRNFDNETLLILGVDPISEPPFRRYGAAGDAAESATAGGDQAADAGVIGAFLLDPSATAVTSDLARRRHLAVGTMLRVLAGARTVWLRVAVILPSGELERAMGGNVALMALPGAQAIFRRPDRVDRIDVILDESRREAALARLRALLPPNARLQRPEERNQQVENLVRAFQLNLTALSSIALFVTVFLIFNTISTAVMRRRREIGILRALGLSRGSVLGMFLFEAVALGVLGTGLGLLLGIGMARTALNAVAETISTLYVAIRAREVVLAPEIFWQGTLIGIGTALLAAIWPARDAAATQPVTTIRQGLVVEPRRLPLVAWAALGVGLLAAAALVALWTLRTNGTASGFLSAFLILVGFSFLTPALTAALDRVLEPPTRRCFGIEGELALRYLTESLPRTAVIIAGVMVSVAMLVGLTVMVASFRSTVDIWVSQTIKADLYVEPAGRARGGSQIAMPPAVIATARRLPGVAAVDVFRGQPIPYEGTTVLLGAVDIGVLAEHGHLLFRQGSSAEILPRMRAAGGVAVTESFARKHHAREGDLIWLATTSGVRGFRVFGVFYDYTTEAGGIMLDRTLYARLWKDPTINSLGIYLRPGVDPAGVRRQLNRRVGRRYALTIRPNQGLRRHIMRVFDQTFRITYALEGISLAVAVLGIINTLTALTLQRGREIGILRAVGALRGQVRKVVLIEAGLIGTLGTLIGSLCGIALSMLLIYVINRQFFGWSIRLRLEPFLFLRTFALMLLTSLAAGLLPARHAASRLAAEAMRLE